MLTSYLSKKAGQDPLRPSGLGGELQVGCGGKLVSVCRYASEDYYSFDLSAPDKLEKKV